MNKIKLMQALACFRKSIVRMINKINYFIKGIFNTSYQKLDNEVNIDGKEPANFASEKSIFIA